MNSFTLNLFKNRAENRRIGLTIKRKIFLLFILFLSSSAVFASHFRYGLVTATRLSETSTTVTYRINVSEAWRLGVASSGSSFSISGGNSGSLFVPLTIVNDPSGGWSNSTGSANVTLNKSATPTRLEYTSCCKISTTINNHDASWDEYIILNTNAPGSSPVSSMPAIINMPANAPAATYTVPASDPDPNSTLTYGIPNLVSGPLAGQTEPSGFSVNSSTGLITMSTVGKSVGQLYNAMVTVTDNNGNQVMLDFIIQIVGSSNPPVFDYSVTPTNGFVYNVIAGQNISFPIKATDSDPGSSVSLSVAGLPAYITAANFSPALPATGNPAISNFSWTPGAAQIGTTSVFNIVATDNVGVQSSTSVTIKVLAEPAPVFIAPTPVQGSIRQISTGVLHQDNIVAQSTLGSNVTIAFATVPSGASLSPAVPTIGANPGQTTMSWTPTPANFGVHNLSYTASISAFSTIFAVRNYQLIVNTPPAFSSTPNVLTVNANQPFSYNVTVSDPDIPYGDVINIVGTTIPSWLTLTSTGNGTAVLSGTPTFANGGLHHVDLEAEDIYHHGNPSHVEQSFDIFVVTCIPPTITCPSQITVNADNGLCGAVVNYPNATVSGTAPTISYSKVSGSLFSVGTTQVVLTATNDCGTATCTFEVTVVDNQFPVLVGVPADVTVECDAIPAAPTVTATDNCSTSVPSYTETRTNGDCPSRYTLTRTWSTTDASNNTTTASQTITVQDTQAPVLSAAPPSITVECNAIPAAAVLTATDNCDAPTVTYAEVRTNSNCPSNYTLTRTWTATDACGNTSSKTQVITVQDTQAPVLSAAPASVTVECNAIPSAAVLTATDNCDAPTVTYAEVSTQNADVNNPGHYNYTLTRTWTATDACGNTSSKTQVITVQDVTAPTAVCKTVNVTLVNGAASVSAAQVDGNSFDNCSPVSLSLGNSKTNFTCANIGANTVTLKVTDVSGNYSTCTATVNVIGEIPTCSITSVPTSNVFTGGVSTNLYLGYGAQSTTLQVNAPASGAPYTYSWSGTGLSSTTSGSPVFTPTTAGTFSFTVLVTNKYGCTTTCSISICVTDIRVLDKKGQPSGKVYVCHIPPGNPGNPQTLEISVNAVPAHVGLHGGDRLGSCTMQTCTTAPVANYAGVDEHLHDSKMEVIVAPNPSTTYFELAVKTSKKEPLSIRILDANGRLVESKNKVQPNSYLTVGNNYVNGIYYAQIIQGNERVVVKLIKGN